MKGDCGGGVASGAACGRRRRKEIGKDDREGGAAPCSVDVDKGGKKRRVSVGWV